MLHPWIAHVPVYLMAAWWTFWLVASVTPLNIFVSPPGSVLAQFGVFIAVFLLGHFLMLVLTPGHAGPVMQPPAGQPVASAQGRFRLHSVLMAMALACLAIVLLSLHMAGALSESFIEYFIKLRRGELSGESLTGSGLLDVATKAIVWPMSYTLVVVALALRIGPLRGVLAIAALNIVLFSYLWQVNYSLIYLFWFFVLYLIVGMAQGMPLDRKAMGLVLLLILVLLAVAANRFGGDVLGGLQRYMFGYHMAGFAFYGHHFHDPSSLLHDHSLGRSSLGFLEQAVEIVSRRLDLGFVAASSTNADFNNEAVDLGRTELIEGNAFGTFLFGLYRDFHFFGIVAGGLVYGALVTLLLQRSRRQWGAGAAFYVLASSWMVGMMVNPIEQVHFWFSLTLIGVLVIGNRGLRP
jgi:oligosaccharide repeat unit polymerase